MVVNSKHLKIARRYALALSAFNDDNIQNELNSILDILATSNDLNEFLQNPVITNTDKKEILEKVFVDFSANVKNFLFILVEKNRFAYLKSIIDEYNSILDEKHNIKRVEIISAVELYDDEKNRLINNLQKKLSCDVKAQYVIDENIIAGLIIKIGDKVIDNSLKTRFEGLKKQLI